MTLYESFFDLSLQICKEFPQITPFSLRKESGKEVCIFIARFIRKNARENTKHQGIQPTQNGKKTIKVGNKVYYEDSEGDWLF